MELLKEVEEFVRIKNICYSDSDLCTYNKYSIDIEVQWISIKKQHKKEIF